MSFSLNGLESIYLLYKNNFKNNSDAICIFVHWYLIQQGCKCLKDNGKISEILPNHWNISEHVYSIKYTSDSKGYELKILEMDEHLMINLARLTDEHVASLTIDTSDYVVDIQNDFERVYKNLHDLYDELNSEFESLFKSPITTKVAAETEKRYDSSEKDKKPVHTDPLRIKHPQRERVPPVNIGRHNLDPFNSNPYGPGGGMIFDPFRPMLRPHIPSDIPRGSVPPGAKFDPFQPPNPESMIPASSRMNPNPDHLAKPPGYDDMFM